MLKRWVLIGVILAVTGLLMGAAAFPAVFFEMEDPVGDDYGYGTYQYPSNIAFEPYQGLFDLTHFKVWSEKDGDLYFDTRFVKITNPWMAPEGYIHQNVRIYIDSNPNSGCTAPVKRGSNIVFDPKFGWETCLKIVGWGNSQLISLENNVLKLRNLKTEVLADGQTIRATVPLSLVGQPDSKWRYYVLVGSYDGFAEDFYRKVMAQSGAWAFGGGLDENIEPNVIDLLAPKGGKHSQEKQLKSFDLLNHKLAEVYPVAAKEGWDWRTWLAIGFLALIIGGAAYLFYRKPRRLSWFWVKRAKNGNH
jgi:carbohydrate-binding DOMON domain-containing protein